MLLVSIASLLVSLYVLKEITKMAATLDSILSVQLPALQAADAAVAQKIADLKKQLADALAAAADPVKVQAISDALDAEVAKNQASAS